MAFYQTVVAPSVGGPLRPAFWTETVAQKLYSEPAARHAIIAISSLYGLDSRHAPSPAAAAMAECARSRLAIAHYNEAIRFLVGPGSSCSLDTVLLVCVLFVCIEFLRGNVDAAATHIVHGVSLLNAAPGPPPRDPLVAAFLHLSLVPAFFSAAAGADLTLPPRLGAGPCPTVLRDMCQAQVWLDALTLRTVRLVRLAARLRAARPPDAARLAAAVAAARPLDADLDTWWAAFCRLGHVDWPGARTTRLFFEARWLHAKMRIATGLDRDELAWASQHDRFRRFVDVCRRVHAAGELRAKRGSGRRVAFVMGFCPMLFMGVHKCRVLPLRLALLELMEALCWDRETTWDRAELAAVGRKIVEVEHGLELTPETLRRLRAAGDDDDDDAALALPRDARLVTDYTLYPGDEPSPGADARTMGIELVLVGPRGTERVREHITVR